MSEVQKRALELDWEGKRRFLQRSRFRPMFDNAFGELLKTGMNEAFRFRDANRAEFLAEFDAWIRGSKLNRVKGLENFEHRDVISGVTHFLDDLHVSFGSCLVGIEKEYAYHRRMKPDFPWRTLETLQKGDILVLAVPFAWHGDLHPQTQDILNRCEELGIPVQIDSAWMGCLRDIEFDYGHPAIRSVAFSLSKGLGLGSHRVGVRYSRERHPGPVTIINDFGMTITSTTACGLEFIRRFGPDYLQNRYFEAYRITCERLGLRPTKAIHTAFAQVENGEWWPHGVRPFLRYLVDGRDEFGEAT